MPIICPSSGVGDAEMGSPQRWLGQPRAQTPAVSDEGSRVRPSSQPECWILGRALRPG